MQIDLLDLQLEASIRGDFDEAWRLAQILERERPQDNRAAFNRGWHMYRRGDFKKGMQLTERGRLEGVYGAAMLKTHKPQWDGRADIKGKTILLRGEGGFGDEIVNIRFAQTLNERGAKVIATVSPGIVPLLKRAKDVSEVIAHGLEDRVQFDYWAPGMSAALFLDLDYSTLPGAGPYLEANPVFVEKWKHIIQGKELKVGIRWSGNPKFEHEQHRRFSPEPLFELAKIHGVQLYSLQRDHDLRDLPEDIIDLQHTLECWEDTAAAIMNLDLVITSCTAVAHLSAALGKETWVIVPILPYYIWALPGETSPWYKAVRLFRQEVFGSWDAPLHNVRFALEQKVAGAKSSMQPLEHAKVIPLPAEKKKQPPSLLQYAGVYLAPKPEPKRDAVTMKHTAKPTLHFMGGLPRAGSTALMSLLSQNPRIYSAPVSGLASIFSGVHVNWDKTEFHVELPNLAAKKRILRGILDNYHETDRPVMLDKDRHWMTSFEQLEAVLERPVKMIIPVRPIPEIVASFEAIRRKHPLEFAGPDEAIGATSTIATRAQYFSAPNGPLGLAYNALKDAVTLGYLDRMLFVDYNKLMSAPKTQLKRIYEFLEEPYFEHDFGKIEPQGQYNWRPHKLPGLHDVRPEFKKEFKSARQILGDVYGQYDQPEPWSGWT